MSTENIEPTGNLRRLSELTDFKVSSGDPDVRGWRVISADGVKFGKVDELIVDMDEMKVRYVDVDVDPEVGGTTKDHHILVPIGVASIDEKEDKVYIRTIETVTLLKAPAYEGILSKEYENSLRQSYLPDVTDEEYYNSEHFDENKFYGPRRRR